MYSDKYTNSDYSLLKFLKLLILLFLVRIDIYMCVRLCMCVYTCFLTENFPVYVKYIH